MADAGAAAAVRADGRLVAAAATREVKRGLVVAGEGTYPSTADMLNTQAPTRATGRALTLIFMTPVGVSFALSCPRCSAEAEVVVDQREQRAQATAKNEQETEQTMPTKRRPRDLVNLLNLR